MAKTEKVDPKDKGTTDKILGEAEKLKGPKSENGGIIPKIDPEKNESTGGEIKPDPPLTETGGNNSLTEQAGNSQAPGSEIDKPTSVYIPSVEDLKYLHDKMTEGQRAEFKKLFSEIFGSTEKTPLEQETEALLTEAEKLHQYRVKKYGEGYLLAEKVGTNQQTCFSAFAWKNLGPAKKDGTKEGWRLVVKTPPEVLTMQNKNGK